ncbi:hypothetical protein B0H13DRAFT_1916981 [Mycena leptocephala]|nr:hypothetical protein B0H13DRAFT_1916981 [Mycena leptocephala]
MAPRGQKRSVRASQPAARSGMGVHFTSPLKHGDTRKSRAAKGLGHAMRLAEVRSRLATRLRGEPIQTDVDMPPSSPATLAPQPDLHTEPQHDGDTEWIDAEAPPALPPPLPAGPARRTRLYESWERLLPLLEAPFANFYSSTHAQQRPVIPPQIEHPCTVGCTQRTKVVRCLYPLHVLRVQITTCDCMPLGVLLVQHGVFPASPSKPNTGVSLDVLDIYRAMFERSCDTINTLAAALHTIYDRLGFTVVSERNPLDHLVDPFRASLTQAVQWSSNLRDRIDKKVQAVLEAAECAPSPRCQGKPWTIPWHPPQPPTRAFHAVRTLHGLCALSTPATSPTSSPAVEEAPEPTLTPGRASRVLRERCPACFGHTEWGRSLDDGGDVQLGADGCFSYRHLRSAGDGPIGYTPSFFIPKRKIDVVAQKMAHAKDNPRAEATLPIPQDIIDECESTFKAANEKTQSGESKRYDAADTISLQHLHSGRTTTIYHSVAHSSGGASPPQATILQAYDIGCVTQCSVNKFPIFDESLRKRLGFIINAMHSYRHKWACHIVFGPRFRLGASLADHEDVERIWSRMRKMVPLTRNQWNSRRMWMIDQYSAFLNAEGQENLGASIERRDKNMRGKLRDALRTFRQCRVTEEEVRRQWKDQKESQTSMRSHAPARLRRELDKVLTLQTQIDGVEKAIVEAKQAITGSDPPPNTVSLLQRLEATHEKLSQQAEELYASLNISGSFPELENLPRAFVHTLLILHDLKVVIRRRAIASFQEWEALDRAVGGRREPLGTKLYQATRRAISKRQPALLKLIAKFNDNCAKLDRLCPVECPIPIPTPLPTRLNALRSDSSLYEDICISPSPSGIPAWLNDDDVRDGIRSLHAIDRCREEAIRLNLDRANLKTWLEHERRIVEKALASHPGITPTSLQERQRYLDSLGHRWAGVLQLQPLPRDLPRGFHPAEAPRTPGQPSSAPNDDRTHSVHDPRSLNRPPNHPPPPNDSVRPTTERNTTSRRSGTSDAQGNRRAWSADAEVEENDSDIEDGGFSDLPADSRDIGEDGALYPGFIVDPEDAADLIGDDDEVEETSGLDSDNGFEIMWDAQPQHKLDRSLLHDLRVHNASASPTASFGAGTSTKSRSSRRILTAFWHQGVG